MTARYNFSFFKLALVLSAFALPNFAGSVSAEELRVPAFTAYMLPDVHSARTSERRGLTGWKDSTQTVNWYGQFANSGELKVKLVLRLPAEAESKLRMSIGNQSQEATATGNGKETIVDFKSFQIDKPGYHRITLHSLNEAGQTIGDIDSLILDGPAIAKAHFNLKERRNAASVHLMYPVPKDTEVEAFYCEATALEDPVNSYYMATGWHRGYFGMQVNSPTERRIIFSVWDSGDEAVDRQKVDDVNRVKLMGKGEGVFSGDFGNEGTGGHSHLKVMWRTGDKLRFIVTAKPVEMTYTIYSGYWFHPDQKKWMLISSWKAPKEGRWLKGLYSFSEDFGGSGGHLVRKGLYGNQWIRTSDQKWIELTQAKFSHDPTGKADRLDRFMGVENGQFFLSHGGFVDGFTQYGQSFTRPATGTPPSDLELPEVK